MKEKLPELMRGAILAKRILMQRDQITEGEFFRDIQTGNRYRRIFGGIGWPSVNTEGCVVVLTEDLFKDYEAETRIIRVIETKYDKDPNGLLDQMEAIQDNLCRVDWYGNTESVWRRLLPDKNADLHRNRKAQIRLFKPPAFDESDKFGAYSQLLRLRVGGVKTFYFDESTTTMEFQQILGDAASMDETIFPGAAAILYALAAMDLRRMPN